MYFRRCLNVVVAEQKAEIRRLTGGVKDETVTIMCRCDSGRCRRPVIQEAPTCLSLPERLLQPVRPHILTGLAHRQLLAAHPSFPR